MQKKKSPVSQLFPSLKNNTWSLSSELLHLQTICLYIMSGTTVFKIQIQVILQRIRNFIIGWLDLIKKSIRYGSGSLKNNQLSEILPPEITFLPIILLLNVFNPLTSCFLWKIKMIFLQILTEFLITLLVGQSAWAALLNCCTMMLYWFMNHLLFLMVPLFHKLIFLSSFFSKKILQNQCFFKRWG